MRIAFLLFHTPCKKERCIMRFALGKTIQLQHSTQQHCQPLDPALVPTQILLFINEILWEMSDTSFILLYADDLKFATLVKTTNDAVKLQTASKNGVKKMTSIQTSKSVPFSHLISQKNPSFTRLFNPSTATKASYGSHSTISTKIESSQS